MVVTHGSLQRARGRCALTIGNFDGVHRGHRALIERVTAKARELELRFLRADLRAAPARILRAAARRPRASRACATSSSCSPPPASSACTSRASTRASPRSAPARFIERRAGERARHALAPRRARLPLRRAARGRLRGAAAAARARLRGRGDARRRCSTGERVSSSAVRAALAAGDFDARRAPARPSVHDQRPRRARREARPRASASRRRTSCCAGRRRCRASSWWRSTACGGTRRGERRPAPDGEPGADAAARGASLRLRRATCTASTCGCAS